MELIPDLWRYFKERMFAYIALSFRNKKAFRNGWSKGLREIYSALEMLVIKQTNNNKQTALFSAMHGITQDT